MPRNPELDSGGIRYKQFDPAVMLRLGHPEDSQGSIRYKHSDPESPQGDCGECRQGDDGRKKETHRHSRWFFICGRSPRILATRHVALHRLAPAYCPTGSPVNGPLHLPEHGQLVSVLVLLQLILDIRSNLRRIFACRVDKIPSTPKLPTFVFELQSGKLFVQHQATLPF